MVPETSAQPTFRKSALRKPVALIGLMGAGKTSVGKRLAGMLGVGFSDSDAEIEAAAQRGVPEIFDEFGEAEFRRLERAVIARLLLERPGGRPGVIATGGGAFMQEETRQAITEQAVSVWLKADVEVLVARTEGRNHRPLLNRGNPREILAELIVVRHPIYALADVHVESYGDQTHEETAERIFARLREAGAVETG